MRNNNVTSKIYSNLKKGFTLISNPGKTNPTGFTLIELLLVIAIIGVLVGIVVVAINPVRLIALSTDSKKRQEMQQLKNSLQLYFNDFNNYPSAADFINPGCADCLVPVYIRELPEEFLGTATAIYSDDAEAAIPGGEYRAGIELSTFATQNDDDGSYTHCGGNAMPTEVPIGGIWDPADYLICPD